MTLQHPRCCDDPCNLVVEHAGPSGEGVVVLVCMICGSILAYADDRNELWADC